MSVIDKSIKYAYIVFGNGVEKIVPVSTIPGFFPKNRKDFKKEQRVKAWWRGNGSKNDYLLNANILLLGTSEADIQTEKKKTRIKYPNKRNMSFTKDPKHQAPNPTATSKSKKIKKSCKKIKLPTVQSTKNENARILKKHAALMRSREIFNESASDESESERNEGEGSGVNSQLEKENPILDKERHVESMEEEIESILDSGSDISDEQYSHAEGNRYSESEERRRNDADQEIVETGSSNSSLLRHRTNSRDTVILENLDEESDHSNNSNNYSAGSSRSHRSLTIGRTVSRRLFSAQELADDQTTFNERRSGSAHGRHVQNQMNTDNDEMVYLGENISVHIDIWETMRAKNDSKFVRELADVIWGREVLKEKCLKAERANKNAANLSPNSLRTELTPKKYQLLKDCLYQKISDAKVVGKAREARMRKVWQYLSKKIYYLRNNCT